MMATQHVLDSIGYQLAVLNNFFFAKNTSQLEVALPKRLDADRVVRLALTAL